MLSRDILVREMQLFAVVIAKLLGFKKAGQLLLAENYIHDKSIEFLKVDFSALLALEDDAFEKLLNDDKYNSKELYLMSELLFEYAQMYSKGDSTAEIRNGYKKALTVFEYLENTEETYSLERASKIELIRKILKQ